MTKSTFRITADLIEHGNIEELKAYFLEDMSRLYEDSSFFGTAIHLAAKEASVPAIECLLELGADPNCVSESGKTPMSYAIKTGSIETVECLLNHGAIINLESPTENPYILSILRGHLHLVHYFLDHDADPNVVVTREDGSKRNALSFALERGESEIVDLLKKHGCTVPPDFESDELEEAVNDRQSLIEYVEARFGSAEKVALQSILPTPGNITVHYIRPSDACSFATIFTTGMSDARMEPEEGAEGYEYAELIWHLPQTWPDLIKSKNEESAMWPLQVMRVVGRYPHLMDTWLGPIPTLSLTDPPQPLGPNTKMSSLLLIPDELEPLNTNEKSINFYTIYPIYQEELNLVDQKGIDALLDRLRENNVSPVLDLNRANLGM